MHRPSSEWNPDWDQDWQAAQPDLEEQLREDHPSDPRKAIAHYRRGFIAAKRHPFRESPENERELYEDYMTGSGEPSSQEGVDETHGWFRRGWDAAREHVRIVQNSARSTRVEIE
jgi:hypothetical protein